SATLALPLAGGAALLLAGAALVYATLGTPGWYGDRLFVVLRPQADLSQAAAITDDDQRRSFVYTTLATHANGTQADLRAHLARFGVESTPYYLVNAVELRGGLLARLLLLGRSEVERVMPSPVMRPIDPLPPALGGGAGQPMGEPQWNLTSIGADRVWRELNARGQGIVIGQSDSGAQWDHPELRDSYRGAAGDHEYNWLDPWTGSPAPVDSSSHGTHTLGSVLGNSVGVAPDATWFACANLQRNIGNPALYLDCMQFMLAPYAPSGDPLRDGDPLRAADVLNNSWGCPQDYEGCDPDSLRTAVDNLTAAGIFVVASAGNDGPECSSIDAPIAIYENAFSVGAIDRSGDLASFSSVGPVTVDGSGRIKPDILAPGVDIYSALPGDEYGENSGTSMAGPHIAGVVALIWSANPALIGEIAQTRQILAETARPFDERGTDFFGPESFNVCAASADLSARPNNIAGYGVVDAYAAVQRALELR
ncbi:MAG: S8 family serine peptidase, partial [Roseiflexaceae bacterium]|nr:S8 family serine peptidase [Roseiflexaceae bacterium]